MVAPDNALLGRELAEALLEDWDGGEVLLLDTAGRCAGVEARLTAAAETAVSQSIKAARTQARGRVRAGERRSSRRQRAG